MTTETRSLYSQLPAIDRLLRDSSFLSLRDTYGHTRVVELLRQMLDEAREVIRGSQTLPAWCENWAQEVDARLTKEAQSALRPVITLTGTVLHTYLGRALQAEAAVEAVAQAMRSPVTLEYDLDDAGRGHRDRALAQLLCRITWFRWKTTRSASGSLMKQGIRTVSLWRKQSNLIQPDWWETTS
ncbi:hypothetical protein ACVWC1_24785, partial [Escherichia coli]